MKAPNFSLPDQNGKIHALSEHEGKWRVVYFYPKDDTPGCTKEACGFRDSYDAFAASGVVVFGISKDSVASHKKFAEKYHLPFSLLSDETTETIQAYGAWGKKKFMGKEFFGIIRKTYLIDPNGDIVKEYEGMDVASHAEEVLRDIKALSGQ